EMPEAPDQVPDADPDIWSVYQRMISLRRRHPWLTRATTRTEEVGNEHLLVRSAGPDAEELTLALNLADTPFRLPHGGAAVEAGAPLADQSLAPHSWAVVKG
ncbi:MAG: DUF3459 domain-containing protein, partial [Friedmanniella sp.]